MDNQYSREYQAYLAYALQRYLMGHCNYTEKDAEIKAVSYTHLTLPTMLWV